MKMKIHNTRVLLFPLRSTADPQAVGRKKKMEVTALRQRYAELRNSELRELAESGGLTEVAEKVLAEEIEKRGGPAVIAEEPLDLTQISGQSSFRMNLGVLGGISCFMIWAVFGGLLISMFGGVLFAIWLLTSPGTRLPGGLFGVTMLGAYIGTPIVGLLGLIVAAVRARRVGRFYAIAASTIPPIVSAFCWICTTLLLRTAFHVELVTLCGAWVGGLLGLVVTVNMILKKAEKRSSC